MQRQEGTKQKITALEHGDGVVESLTPLHAEEDGRREELLPLCAQRRGGGIRRTLSLGHKGEGRGVRLSLPFARKGGQTGSTAARLWTQRRRERAAPTNSPPPIGKERTKGERRSAQRFRIRNMMRGAGSLFSTRVPFISYVLLWF